MSESNKSYIVYDGECPFCSQYVKLLKLKSAIGEVQLIDARQSHPVVTLLQKENIDLNEGMALVQGNRIFHGDECINKIALMSTNSDMLNRLNALIFRSSFLSRILYPILRAGRNVSLKILGKSKIYNTTR